MEKIKPRTLSGFMAVSYTHLFYVADPDDDLIIDLPDGLMVPASRINALRRTALNLSLLHISRMPFSS